MAELPKDSVSSKYPQGLGSMIGSFLPYVMIIAGLSLLFLLIVGGITLMTSAGDPNKAKEGSGKITAGLIGFLIIILAYFITQLVEVVLGVKFL